MRSGAYLPSQGPFADLRLLVELAREAEMAGPGYKGYAQRTSALFPRSKR